ncbi:Retrovirus-related Pol polyprotein from transposon TNT 1-94 [Vitis vinifera]|uniref:Retrovirus-related Pol polyprotein from transposon TNT 1-94 n=1 Tax=Vitis vinifera TaxID=29760 RepID=A0A438G544_VITVI|nr:Retrovirus-related Pol polyprotein from transposon TNT 1-94 [Vitis vinifera]
MNQDLVRLDRFDGSNFTRWQDKVRFLLTALKIFYILDPTLAPLPEPKENDTPQVVAARKKREEDELICRGHILNALSDRLYDLYTNTNSAREIWEALENKYKAEEEVIVNKLKVLKIELPEAFQVGAIVAKLPSSWKESRSRDKMVEESNGGTNKANAFQRPIILEVRKDLKGAVVNAIDEEIIATLSDVCVVQGKVQGWWYDTCATVHVTYDKSLFKTFEDAKGDQEVQMGNEGRSKVLGKGTIEVVFTSGKKVTLINVLYVPDMNKNLVSGDLLGKPGIKAVFESGKLILSKSGNFVGKGLAHVGLSTIKRIVKCGLIACDTKKFENDLCELNGMLTRGGNSFVDACHILNRIPMKKNEISPYELWKGRKPNIGYFKVWGCLAYCKKTDPNKTKLGPRAIKCAFVGYASNSKAYRLLDLESNVIIESREVEFFENLLSDSNSQVPTSVGESQEETPSKVVEQPIVPRKSQRARKEKVTSNRGGSQNIQRSMASRDVAFWKEAINDEMDSIMSNQTWELVDLPPGSKPIGCKWVFRRKYHTDGMIQTFKARLVAKGFKQREGIDYFDTYAPVARTTSIRILFALASIHNLFVHQMDVKTAFLNGDLMRRSTWNNRKVLFYWGMKTKCVYSNPSVEHWKAIGRVLGYLKNTKELSLQYSKFPAIIEGYSDASWISSVGDNLSTTGWVFTLGGGAVSWGSKKQTCISHSTMEAEFIALAATGKEVSGLGIS